jgi:hypothetical protein
MTEEEFKKLQERVKRLENFHDIPILGEGCLWDSMPETSPGSGVKIAGLSCPCPKCSPRC